jgi:CubicO group peptidase (beta-lactamase class C family)
MADDIDSVSPTTARALRRLILERQRGQRVPGIFAGVIRNGRLIWQDGVGAADLSAPDAPPGPDDQFLVASNTKTFTAVLIMQLRDEGKLSLEDPLERHIPSITHTGVTIRSALAHVSGMQREPVGDVWETLDAPDVDALLRGFNEAERMHRPHHVFHYSNLVFSVLGEIVAQVDGRPWTESLQTRLLDPLGMTRTTVGFTGRHAQGYYVPPYSDVARPEPYFEPRALAPCGGLASTGVDMARWSAFVADPPAEILAPATLEEMLQPQIMTDVARWSGAFGLGFMLHRSDTRVYAGHTGGMPGHITALFTDRASQTGAVVLMNGSASGDPAALAVALADHVTDNEPAELEPWRPGSVVPDDLVEILGLWFSEGQPYLFSVREGRLEARGQGQPDHVPPAVFVKLATDLYRAESGLEQGELLRITRAADGSVAKMNWVTYRFTRQPLGFGQ